MKKSTLLSITTLIVFFITAMSLKYLEKQPDKIKPLLFEGFNSNIIIEEDPSLEKLGVQQTVGGVCFIKLKKYPTCLQHEVRHCIEGNFHEGKDSDEDCFE